MTNVKYFDVENAHDTLRENSYGILYLIEYIIPLMHQLHCVSLMGKKTFVRT